MLKRISILPAIFAISVGALFGFSPAANATTHSTSGASYVYARPYPQTTTAVALKYYVVKPGNVLTKIAEKFDLNWKKFYCANKKVIGNDPNLIRVGEKLKVRQSREVWCSISTGQVFTSNSYSTSTISTPSYRNYYGSGGYQQCVIMAESGGDPTAYNNSSGASGLYGFLLSTWLGTPYGGAYPGGAYTAPPSVQTEAFFWLYARDGRAPWITDGC